MKVMRKPIFNATIILLITAFYSLVFILTSGHMEFARIINHPETLSSSFWNNWSDFLTQGNLKYIGYSYIVLAVVIVILSCMRKRDYDEYQTDFFEKGLIIAGLVMIILFPVALLLIFSDANYAIETLSFLVVAHWTTFLIADLVYVIKWIRN